VPPPADDCFARLHGRAFEPRMDDADPGPAVPEVLDREDDVKLEAGLIRRDPREPERARRLPVRDLPGDVFPARSSARCARPHRARARRHPATSGAAPRDRSAAATPGRAAHRPPRPASRLASSVLLCDSLERLQPSAPVVVQPPTQLHERLGIGPVEPQAAFAALVDETGLAQDAEVTGDGGATDVEGGGKLSCGELAVSDELENSPADRVGDRCCRFDNA
jgi:hypothetical protein